MGANRLFRSMLALFALLLVASIVFNRSLGQNPVEQMAFSTLQAKLDKGDVKSVVITESTAEVALNKGDTKYSVNLPAAWSQNNVFNQQLAKTNDKGEPLATVTNERSPFSSPLFSVLGLLLPLILFGAFWIFIMRQSQSGAGQAMSFGKSKAKRLTDSSQKVTFADVAGVDEAKQELQEVIDFLKNPEKFQALGAKIPRGVLACWAIPAPAKRCWRAPWLEKRACRSSTFRVRISSRCSLASAPRRVRDLFDQAKAHRPAIVFIDEIDAVGRHRGAGMGGGHDEREQTLNQLLVEMDGFDPNSGVILMAATNRPDVLDPALTRPGRFDRQIIVDNPDSKGRLAILGVHAKGKPIASGVDLDVISRRTAGFSGADLANLVNEAALLAARRNKQQIGEPEFEESIERVISGPERKSRIIQEREKTVIAYHEVGHALLGKLLPNIESPHKITILPRGMALGYVLTLPSEDQFLQSKSQILDSMTSALGGRAAEQVVFNETWTGAQNDLEKVTDMARRMICEFGMSEKLGPIQLGKRSGPVFLGRDFNEERNYSEEIAAKIDGEVRAVVDSCFDKAIEMLTENRAVMDRIVNVLLEKETLSAEELDRIMNGEPEPPELTPTQPPTPPTPASDVTIEKVPPRTSPGGLTPGLAGA